MQVFDAASHQFLLDKKPEHWSRVFFDTHSKSDSVDNNMVEIFNGFISKISVLGLLCCHALARMRVDNIIMEEFVHKFYSLEMYRKTYAQTIIPINGQNL